VVSRIERRLSATGLPWIVVDIDTDALENADHVHAGFGEKLISDTGNEERNFHCVLMCEYLE
jgi:hypothetical protein